MFNWDMFPYADFHRLNLDWVLEKVREAKTQSANAVKIANDNTETIVEYKNSINSIIDAQNAEIAAAKASQDAEIEQIRQYVINEIAKIPTDVDHAIAEFINSDNFAALVRAAAQEAVANLAPNYMFLTGRKFLILADAWNEGLANQVASLCEAKVKLTVGIYPTNDAPTDYPKAIDAITGETGYTDIIVLTGMYDYHVGFASSDAISEFAAKWLTQNPDSILWLLPAYCPMTATLDARFDQITITNLYPYNLNLYVLHLCTRGRYTTANGTLLPTALTDIAKSVIQCVTNSLCVSSGAFYVRPVSPYWYTGRFWMCVTAASKIYTVSNMRFTVTAGNNSYTLSVSEYGPTVPRASYVLLYGIIHNTDATFTVETVGDRSAYGTVVLTINGELPEGTYYLYGSTFAPAHH